MVMIESNCLFKEMQFDWLNFVLAFFIGIVS